MLGFLWEASRGYRLRPWSSPYVLWRIETYTGRKADDIGFLDFWRISWQHRHSFLRFLTWASANRIRHIR